MARVHAFGDDPLQDLDAVGLVEAYRDGLSVSDVVEAAIARADAVDDQLGALAHEAFEQARAEGRSPRPGYFSGVPTFLKDNVDVAGMPTQNGTDAYVARPADADGDFARMYRSVGLLPLGKTRLSEFGFSGAVDHPRLGPVRTPWNPEHYAGASSAGAAAFVATGVVPIAHANDGGGSIRIPASVNGLVGLKPTRGRLAQDATMRQMPVKIVSDGVLTRSVRDTAAFYREAEKVYRDPGSHRSATSPVPGGPGSGSRSSPAAWAATPARRSPSSPSRRPRCSSPSATRSRRSTPRCRPSSPTTSSSTGRCSR